MDRTPPDLNPGGRLAPSSRTSSGYGRGRQQTTSHLDPDMSLDNLIQKGRNARQQIEEGAKQDRETPLQVLHKICSKANGQVTFPKEQEIWCSEPGRRKFLCEVQVTSSFGQVFHGKGIGSSKQNAKHAAARDILKIIHPEAEVLLTKEPEVAIETRTFVPVSENPEQRRQQHCQMSSLDLEQLTQRTQAISITGGGGDGGAPPKEEEGDRGGQLLVSNDGGRLTITLRLPEYVNPKPKDIQAQGTEVKMEEKGTATVTPPPSPKQLSLTEKIEVVSRWNGRSTLKLKQFTMEMVLEMNDPIRAAAIIIKEQNLKLDCAVFEEENKEGFGIYSCIMEVFPGPPPSPALPKEEASASSAGVIKQPPCLNFTLLGSGSTADDAQRVAATNFLLMIRIMLNSD